MQKEKKSWQEIEADRFCKTERKKVATGFVLQGRARATLPPGDRK